MSGMTPCVTSILAVGSNRTAITLCHTKPDALKSLIGTLLAGHTYIIATLQRIGNLTGAEEQCSGVVLDC